VSSCERRELRAAVLRRSEQTRFIVCDDRRIPSVMREQLGNCVADVIVSGQLRAGRLSMGSVIVGGTRTPIGLIITVPAADSSS
jgi:hypothetical protein